MRNHLQALLLPITVVIVIPALLMASAETTRQAWEILDTAALIVGIGFMLGGLGLIVVTVRLFILIGRGTLAPWSPTQKLVVRGVYRHVRNPMISGVISTLFGEALVFRSLPLLLWALFVTVLNLVYIPLSEEPGLRARFGKDYDDYTQHVPRWLPRLTPWSQ